MEINTLYGEPTETAIVNYAIKKNKDKNKDDNKKQHDYLIKI